MLRIKKNFCEKIRRQAAPRRERSGGSACRWDYDLLNYAKKYARGRLAYMVKIKAIKQGVYCQACGAESRTEAHHEDYSEALRVMWLCPDCHRKLHGKNTRLILMLRIKKNFQEKTDFM